MELLEYFNTKDAFIRGIGAVMTRCEPGLAVMELELEPRHMSSIGFYHAHAGLLYALAQTASSAAVLSYGHDAFALEGRISFLGSMTGGKLIITAKAKDLHEQETGKCTVRVADQDGRLIATVGFVTRFTGKPFLPE